MILHYSSPPPKQIYRNLWLFHCFRIFFSLLSVLFFVGGLPHITIGYKWLEPSFGWIPLWHSIGDWDWLSRNLYRACIPFQHTRWLNSRCDCLSLKPSKLCPAIQQTGCLKIQWSVKGLIFLMKLQLGVRYGTLCFKTTPRTLSVTNFQTRPRFLLFSINRNLFHHEVVTLSMFHQKILHQCFIITLLLYQYFTIQVVTLLRFHHITISPKCCFTNLNVWTTNCYLTHVFP